MTDQVRVTRTINAPARAVFAAWVDAEQLRQWLCPGPAVLTEARCDPVVGGSYRFVMVSAHGASQVSGEYLVVDPPRRLVFTWQSDSVSQQTQVSVLLEPAGPATRMTIVHERVPGDGPYAAIASGWSTAASNLARLVAAPGPPS